MRKDQILKLHTSLLKALDNSSFRSAVPLAMQVGDHGVADSPSKSYVLDVNDRRVGVLIVSNPVNPHLISRSVEKAQEAKQSLGSKLGSVVLQPIDDGVFSGLSFAVWPLQRDVTQFRVWRYVQRRQIRRRALPWLRAATRHTMRSDLGAEISRSLYKVPIERMVEDTRFSEGLRHASAGALGDLNSGVLRPVTVLQHSDLWLGNFLLPYSRNTNKHNTFGFFIIDWGGASLSGHPFFDLLRFSMSSGLTPPRLHSEISAHCQILGCRLADAVSYTIAGLGILGMNLEHFPEAPYLEMCENVFDAVSAGL